MLMFNAGASVVNINIISNGITVFTRDVTIGGNQFTEEIQKQLNVSYEEAEALKIGGGRGDADAVVPQEVERVMGQVAEQVAGEIQRSLDFYAGTAPDSNFTRVYLSGGTAKIPALFKTIEQRVGVAAVLALALVLNAAWYLDRNSTSNRNQEKIAASKARIAELEKVIGEVNNINHRKREVEEKLRVLDELRRGRSGPVRMLDA